MWSVDLPLADRLADGLLETDRNYRSRRIRRSGCPSFNLFQPVVLFNK